MKRAGGEKTYLYNEGDLLAVGTDTFVGVRVIGQGGMGLVLAVRDMSLGGKVKAMKILLPEASEQDPRSAERFRHEARVGAILEHPNLVKVERLGMLGDGNLFFLMEYIEGESLWHAQKRRGRERNGDRRLSPMETIHIGMHVLKGLAHAHAREIVHCDMKPGNVLLGRNKDGDMHSWVGDFGVMRLGDDDSHAFAGTLSYASYEQVMLESVTHKSDVYSVGAMLYEMLTGELPFGRPDESTTVPSWRERMRRGAPSLATRGSFDAALVKVIDSALSADPDVRPLDAHRFGETLFAIRQTLEPDDGDPHKAITIERPLAEIHARMHGTALTRTQLDPTQPTGAPSWVRGAERDDARDRPARQLCQDDAQAFLSTEDARAGQRDQVAAAPVRVNRTVPLAAPVRSLSSAPASQPLPTAPPRTVPSVDEPPMARPHSIQYVDSAPKAAAHVEVTPSKVVVVDQASASDVEHIKRFGPRPSTSLEPRHPVETPQAGPTRRPPQPEEMIVARQLARNQLGDVIKHVAQVKQQRQQRTLEERSDSARTAVAPPSVSRRLRWRWDSLSRPARVRWLVGAIAILGAILSAAMLIHHVSTRGTGRSEVAR